MQKIRLEIYSAANILEFAYLSPIETITSNVDACKANEKVNEKLDKSLRHTE